MNHKKIVFPENSIGGYIIVLILSVLYALNINGKQGFIFIFVLVLVPVFSFLESRFIARNGKIQIDAEVFGTTIEKGEATTLRLKIKNNSIFPVPMLIIKPYIGENFKRLDEDKPCVGLSASPRSEFTYDINYTAFFWGCSPVYIAEVYVYDFMGFFKKKMTPVCYTMLSEKIKVIPDIPKSPYDSPLTSFVSTEVFFDNDCDDTKEKHIVTCTGMPGYNHKEYVIGDPVRRINWKMSSKRDKIMVRLDDEVPVTRQIVVLDRVHGKSFTASKNAFYSPACDERAVEGSLSLVMALVKQDIDIIYWYFDGKIWVQKTITCPDEVQNLRLDLSAFIFDDYDTKRKTGRIPDFSGTKSNIVLFTPYPDSELVAGVENTADLTGKVSYIIPKEYAGTIPQNSWIILKDYKIYSYEELTK